MTLQDMIDLSKRLTYQGLPCMKVYQCDWRAVKLRLPEGYVYISTWIWSPDVDEPGKRVKIESGGLVSVAEIENSNLDSQISHIRDTLILLQMHEVGEWIKLDEKRIFDPHNLNVKVTKEEEVLREAA